MPDEGAGIVQASWWGTAAFVVAAAAATIAPDQLANGFALLCGAFFFVGIVVFLWAFGLAVQRSRDDAIGIGGLYFLQGSAPGNVQALLLVPLGVEVVVALVSASVRIYTPLAFGLLVPMYGLGLAGLWGARFGAFDRRG
jgi:hypothetical protein